jgi:hypothetical protein
LISDFSAKAKGLIPDFDADFLFEIFSKIFTNSFAIDYDLVAVKGCVLNVATALTIPVSFFNHSCKPNATVIQVTGIAHEVRSLTVINPGDEISISYIDINQDRESRQLLLKAGWFFDCNCSRCCCDEEHLMKEIREIKGLLGSTPKQVTNENDERKFVVGEHNLELQLYRLYQKSVGNYQRFLIDKLLVILVKMIYHISYFEEDSVKDLISETEKSIRVVYGVNHPQFFRFQKIMNMASERLLRNREK